MNAISVNKNIKVNQVSSRTHFVRADSNLVDFFIGDKMKTKKRCSKCKQTKPLLEFYKHPKYKNGYRSECKICFLKRTKEYNRSEKGKIVNLKAVKKYQKTKKGKVVDKRSRACRPNQIKAKNAVNNAIYIGKLVSTKFLLCNYCPKPAQQYHHWHGYKKEHWLDVVPVCRNCHRKINKRIA